MPIPQSLLDSGVVDLGIDRLNSKLIQASSNFVLALETKMLVINFMEDTFNSVPVSITAHAKLEAEALHRTLVTGSGINKKRDA